MSDSFDPNEMTPEQVAELAKAGREGAAAGQYLSAVLQGISAEEAARNMSQQLASLPSMDDMLAALAALPEEAPGD